MLALELIRKYNIPAPRYTSYPTAPKFDSLQWSEILASNKQYSSKNLSLYFHLPFCRSLCWFCGCHTVITQKQEKSAEYLESLCQEIALQLPQLSNYEEVSQIHFGGGSPNFFKPAEIIHLAEKIRKHLVLDENGEFSVELDPRQLTAEHIQAFAQFGCNRASIGVQDINTEVQKGINRIQTRENNINAVNLLRRNSFRSINVDLIYGLPLQNCERFLNSLIHIKELDPDRVALFSYAHVPWLKPTQKVLEKHLPSTEIKFEMFKLAVEFLSDLGYRYIGLDHFAKPQDELCLAQDQGTLQRNFQGYSTKSKTDIYALGISAISQSEFAYWQNTKDLTDYYKKIANGSIPTIRGYFMTNDDLIRKKIIFQIMCNLELRFSEIEKEFQLNFLTSFNNELVELEALAEDGLVLITPASLKVTELGRFFLRNIAKVFDKYLQTENKPLYSKTI